MLPYSGWNVDEHVSDDSNDGKFVKTIIVGGIIGDTLITLVGAHWMILQKKGEASAFVKPETGLDTLILSCDTPPYLTLQMNSSIGNTISFNEDTILSTA